VMPEKVRRTLRGIGTKPRMPLKSGEGIVVGPPLVLTVLVYVYDSQNTHVTTMWWKFD
jgi:hypothetical protein